MPAEVLVAARWVHFLAGITWIGLLYFFNLVNTRTMANLDQAARPAYVSTLLPRALAWFRHSAWVTVLAGLVLIYGLYWQNGHVFDTANARTIFVGTLLGLIMLFNVWVFIWPNQKKIIEATRGGQKADPSWARTALYASRTNFTLSFPMLFYMATSSHNPLDDTAILGVLVVAGALGFVVVYTVQKWWAARF